MTPHTLKCCLLGCVAATMASNPYEYCGSVLELRPSPNGGEYQLDIDRLPAGAGIYRLSAWVRLSWNLVIPPESRTVFHSRFFDSTGAEIGSGTNLVFDEDLWPTAPGVYQHFSVAFDTGDVAPSLIEWYVGYPMLHTAGNIRMTGLQVEAPDGQRSFFGGNGGGRYSFTWAYNEAKSYGLTGFVDDCAFISEDHSYSPVYINSFRVNTTNMSPEVNDIPLIKRSGGILGATFTITGSQQPNTFGSLSYSWFETPGDPDLVDFVVFLNNVLVYFDANGYVTTPSPKNPIVSDEMLFRPSRSVSGIEFLKKYYAGSQFDHTHLSFNGLRFENGSYTFQGNLPALLFNEEKKGVAPLTLDLSFGQPNRYVPGGY
eukprot:CAMPEP_0198657330 /NCGR_PEP_ID=MMETSP1467-20131203/14507_1 /TAXON_ID=1462469 /ORGANISM="unid. sp., Strain CCMP2135" /LENGTH=371 /DNA_ID=CAMNT_0044393495 /DNA_START=43 /DNA_END=1158 /DNA_ORIENTATION=-